MANNGNPTGREVAAERRIQALEMRKQGHSYRVIGERLGVSAATAFGDVKKELDKLAKVAGEIAEDVRAIELQRLDDMLAALWPEAMLGNPVVIDRVLRIQERRAKLLGLDAPEHQIIETDEIRVVMDV